MEAMYVALVGNLSQGGDTYYFGFRTCGPQRHRLCGKHCVARALFAREKEKVSRLPATDGSLGLRVLPSAL